MRRQREETTHTLEICLANLGASLCGSRLGVHFQKLASFVLGGPENLCFPDVDVLKRVDALAGLFNLSPNGFGEEFLNEFFEVASGSFANHDFKHFLSDFSDLRRFSVSGLLHLVGALLGESNAEKANEVAVGCLDVDVSLDQGLPLSYKRSELV